jgi:hypothetical protein
MTSDPAYVRDFKDFTKGELVPANLHTYEQEAYGGSDRARAIMLSVVAENALDDLVRSKIRSTLNSATRKQLFGFDGIFGSFGAQILVAYSLGWINENSRHDLDHIRIIRNGFAHCLKPFDFETPECAVICAHLKCPDDPGYLIPHGYLQAIPDEMLMAASDPNHPRTRYVKACHIMAERLLYAAHPEEYSGIDMP